MQQQTERGLSRIKRHLHLSDAQWNVLRDFWFGHTDRPDFKQYEAFQKAMKAVDPKGKKPTFKSIPNTRKGFEPKDVKLDEAFQASTDLPVGYGVYSHYDSGSNFGILSAGQIALTSLWNFAWTNPNWSMTLWLEEKFPNSRKVDHDTSTDQ